jgi:hypothetical protein
MSEFKTATAAMRRGFERGMGADFDTEPFLDNLRVVMALWAARERWIEQAGAALNRLAKEGLLRP